MKSREQLVDRALRELGVLGAGQKASAEDAKAVDDEVGPVLSDLAGRGVYSYGDPDQIEDEAYTHLATILASAVSAQFGIPQDDTKRLYAEGRLQSLRIRNPPSRPVAVRYF